MVVTMLVQDCWADVEINYTDHHETCKTVDGHPYQRLLPFPRPDH